MTFAVMMIVSFLEMCLVSFAVLTSGHQQLQPWTSKNPRSFSKPFPALCFSVKERTASFSDTLL
jgi:hypothetical protein